jgi:hypothetical protein
MLAFSVLSCITIGLPQRDHLTLSNKYFMHFMKLDLGVMAYEAIKFYTLLSTCHKRNSTKTELSSEVRATLEKVHET